MAYIVGGAAAIAVVLLMVGLVRWVGGRLDDAANRVASAEQQVVATTRLANEEVRSAREDANRQIGEARQLAQRAETVGVILAAPDLIRFNLTSTLADGSSAQVLWSRTRGIVLSASRLPARGHRQDLSAVARDERAVGECRGLRSRSDRPRNARGRYTAEDRRTSRRRGHYRRANRRPNNALRADAPHAFSVTRSSASKADTTSS